MRTNTAWDENHTAAAALCAALALCACGGDTTGQEGAGSDTTASTQPLVYGTPTVPLVLDGVKHAPQDIHLFDGQPLNFVLDQQALAAGVLYVFTKEEGRRAYLQAQGLSLPEPTDLPEETARGGEVLPTSSGSNSSVFYADCGYHGCSRSLPVGYAVRCLVQEPFCSGGNWNDKISSVRTTASGRATVLYWDCGFKGPTFTIPAGVDVPCLVPYGWNDQASSLAVFR